MASIALRFGIVGDNRMESFFDHLEQIPDDFREPFEKMAEDFWEHEETVFDSEGPGWRPLTPKYAKWKEKHYPGKPIMERTGALKASLTEGIAADSVFLVYPTRMELGTTNPYAIYHQTGSIKVPNHPPKRKLMSLPAELQRQWNRRMVEWLRDEIDYRG
jgi:phage gpG-like protein